MKFLLLVALVLFAGLVIAQTPDCSADVLASTTPANLKRCFDTVPIDAAQQAKILSSFKVNVEASTMTPLYAAGTAPYTEIKVDLVAEIDKMAAKTYSSAFDFHLDLQHLIYLTRDAHLRYSLPSAYRDWEIIRPYIIKITEENGKGVVTLEGCNYDCTGCPEKTITRLNRQCDALTKHFGKVITKVNGKDAFDYYVNTVAAANLEHTDKGGMLNSVLSSFSLVPFHDYYKGGYRKADRFVFADGKRSKCKFITNNWNSGVLSNIPDSLNTFADDVEKTFQEFFGPDSGIPDSASQRNLLQRKLKFSQVIKEFRKNAPGTKQASQRSARAVTNICSDTELELTIGDEVGQLYHCSFAKTGETVQVFKFPTFSDDTFVGFNSLISVVQDAIDNSISKIVIDIRGNGGGYGPLAYMSNSIFTGSLPTQMLSFWTLKRSAGLDNLFKGSYGHALSGIFPINASTEIFPVDYFTDSVDVTYAFGRPGDKFIQPAFFGNSNAFTSRQELFNANYPEAAPIAPTPPYKEIIILTNGQCFSACSIFCTTLRDLTGTVQAKVKFVAIGGEPGIPYDVSNVATNILPGTPTITWRAMLVGTDSNGLNGNFRQFQRYDADIRLPIWERTGNSPDIWSMAIDQFGFNS